MMRLLTIPSPTKENNALGEKVFYLENYTRRQNIRIVGIPEMQRALDQQNL